MLDRWDVGLVPFPFSDRNSSKKRPALALSSRAFNGSTGVTVLSMVTKAELSAWPEDYVITEWQSAGLLLPSIVRFKVFTVENSLILRQLGRLQPADAKAVLTRIRNVLP